MKKVLSIILLAASFSAIADECVPCPPTEPPTCEPCIIAAGLQNFVKQ